MISVEGYPLWIVQKTEIWSYRHIFEQEENKHIKFSGTLRY